jgi:hypothetical protein
MKEEWKKENKKRGKKIRYGEIEEKRIQNGSNRVRKEGIKTDWK